MLLINVLLCLCMCAHDGQCGWWCMVLAMILTYKSHHYPFFLAKMLYELCHCFLCELLLQQTTKTSFGTCVCVLWNIDQHCCIHQHEYEWRIADSSLNTHKLYASLTMSVHSDSLPTFQLSDRSLCSLCIHFCSCCHCLIGLLLCAAYARNSLANGGYLNWLHHRYGVCTCVFSCWNMSTFLFSCWYISAECHAFVPLPTLKPLYRFGGSGLHLCSCLVSFP